MGPTEERRRAERRAAMAESDRRRREAIAKRTQRRRLAWIAGAWGVFVVPGLVLAWFIIGWVGALVFFAGLLWATLDYYRSGGMVDSIESSQRAGGWLPAAFDEEERRH